MANDLEVRMHHVPILDTGIGIEMGYESDKAFLAAEEAKRAELDPEVRLALESLDRAVEDQILGRW